VRKILIIFLFIGLITLSGCTSDAPATSGDSTRMIQFSGYSWKVKSNLTPVGPGPNIFSNNTNNVRVDAAGHLHMKITREGNQWACAEIISEKNFGYGNYVFTLKTDPKVLDPEIVLGLFTWDDNPEFFHREIDIEFSQWEIPGNKNAQYVVQPWDRPRNMNRFNVDSRGNITTHSFNWQPDRITFTSYYGPYTMQPPERDIISSWEYRGENIPSPGDENARINFWLINGEPPTDGKEREFIIQQFFFIP